MTAAIYEDLNISIHALRKESDFSWRGLPPTVDISIHALRKESDQDHATHQRRTSDFNPRSP